MEKVGGQQKCAEHQQRMALQVVPSLPVLRSGHCHLPNAKSEIYVTRSCKELESSGVGYKSWSVRIGSFAVVSEHQPVQRHWYTNMKGGVTRKSRTELVRDWQQAPRFFAVMA